MNRFTSIFTTRLMVLTLLAACALPAGLQAASLTASGYTNSFNTQPAAADWSTYSIAGASADNATVILLDSNVQLVAASTIIPTQTLPIAMDPPDFNGLATWSSTGFYLQTRPTGNGITLLMLTLVNNLGLDPGVLAISYDLAEPVIAGEAFEGHRAYVSRTGAAGSWIPIETLSFPTPGRVTASVDVVWPNGTTLYLLWADDNGGPSPDTTTQIDNFSVKRGVLVPVGIITQPQSQTVLVSFPATLSVVASGSNPSYQWQKETPPGSGTFINVLGATSANYVIGSAQTNHSGTYRVIVSNGLGSVTSAVATVSVVTDQFGPRMISAVVADTSTNLIRLVWDERVTPASASTAANFLLTISTATNVTTNRVPIQFVSYNPGPPSQTTLTIATNIGVLATNNW